MESVYYAMSWACHRKCKHCYEDKFRPYVRGELERVVAQAEANAPRVIANLPEDMTFLDLDAPDPEAPEGYARKVGRIIVSGGEVLVEPARTRVLYPALERLRDRYGPGRAKVVVQTTGDLLTEEILDDLLARGVWMISVAGMDDFHVGMEGEKRVPLVDRLAAMFERAGVERSGLRSDKRKWQDEDGPLYSMFGATPDAWIGRIWPRGRGWSNDLSKATIADNFCNAWSGGLGFLNHRFSGSEVAVDPAGDVYPCCLKTKAPIGNLTEEPLIEILDSLVGVPAFEAIAMGHPERMGLAHGWDVATFVERSRTKTVGGRDYRNLCVGCDRFHEEVLGPVIAALRQRRLAARAGRLAA
jgi:Iron-sulfur cluster-binding domain